METRRRRQWSCWAGERRYSRRQAQQALGLDGCVGAFPGRAFRDLPTGIDRAVHPRRLPRGRAALDPFLGAGTTALVADRLGRHCIGIELSPAYAEMARIRTAAPALKRDEKKLRGAALPDPAA